MAGTVFILDVVIVFGAGIFVFHQKADGRPGGHAVINAGQNFHRVRFLALGGVLVLPGTSFVHMDLDIGFAQRNTRWGAIDNAANSRTVAFAEGSKSK